jgi:AbrB family looped-hinge helix DNA binding protein
MIISKITAKGQVTIPKTVREFLKVNVSDKIEFTLLEEGKVLITSEQKSADALFGMLHHRKRSKPVTPEEMDAVIRERRQKRNAK